MPFYGFKGGIHPPYSKSSTSGVQTVRLEVKEGDLYYIPLAQHIGAPAKALVKKNDEVKAGQLIGASAGFISANIHSSVDGIVTGIENVPHPIAGKTPAVIIKAAEQSGEYVRLTKKEKIQETVLAAGITGLGGATFPSHVKLSPPKEVDALLINGAECEPYLTCDHRIMVERAEEIIKGAELVRNALKIKKLAVGIEDNKPDALEKFRELQSKFDFEVVSLETKYPQGGEKQLIKAILDRVVPEGKLPLEVGAIVQNVGTMLSVYEAVTFEKPLFERVVTVTGAVNKPLNVLVKIGTPVSRLIEFCGGFVDTPKKVVMGGPMMGFAITSLDTPVMKGTSGLVAFRDIDMPNLKQYNCIRCSKCIEVCPMELVPSLMDRFVVKELYEELADWHVMNCIECGCCSYVCPSRRTLASGFKTSKRQVMQIIKKREEAKNDRAD